MTLSTAQVALAEKHGTPVQFEAACWRAYGDLFITTAEVLMAVAKYQREWEAAADRPIIGESTSQAGAKADVGVEP
jgi:hypothetical protein